MGKMRLINTKTYEFVWVNDPTTVDYAILSHVWVKDGEQSFQELVNATSNENHRHDHGRACDLPSISSKIRRCCVRALADGYEYVWIDSCCIDKSSSAELSEAINSMYRWYECASRCYAILEDVDADDNPYLKLSQFRRSVWFTRGWTLQELIAPALVIFLSKDWNPIGTKYDLAPIIEQVTGIDVEILTRSCSPTDVSVARRMSWAAKRVTTREEDAAYSLLGLFGIHMPTIYGEGQHAFIRLQEEILKQIPDDTLFTWGRRLLLRESTDIQSFDRPCVPDDACDRLFAASPYDFALTADFRPISHDTLLQRLGILDNSKSRRSPPTYTTTRFGVRAELPLLAQHRSAYTVAQVKIGFLLCEDAEGRFVALILRAASTDRDLTNLRDSDALLVGARIPRVPEKKRWLDHRLVTLTSDVLDSLRKSRRISSSIVHIFRGLTDAKEYRVSARSSTESHPCRAPCTLLLPAWRKAALASQGITVKESVTDGPSKLGGDDSSGRRHVFKLSHCAGAFRIVVDICMRTLCFRMQMQILSSEEHPAADAEGRKPQQAKDGKSVELLSRCGGPKSTWEYSLRGFEDFASMQVLRLSITSSESPRDLVLILDIEFLEQATSTHEQRDGMGSSSKGRKESDGSYEPLSPITPKDDQMDLLSEEEAVASRRTKSRIPVRRPGQRRNHSIPA